MATYTPPPYFPQGSLAPPDPNRYRKFKMVLTLVALVIVLLVGALGVGIWYLIKAIF
ncbi:MAG TPA: hypothetical protein VKB46_16415 [Pyrinomonadaceae bacterium]|nr:hypothetical protein [Pyrinomonadaceae bacterium]